jgi:hypothetical protein
MNAAAIESHSQYIYGVVVRDARRIGEPVLKVGKTSRGFVNRYSEHPGGSILLFVVPVRADDLLVAETVVLAALRKRYRARPDLGAEYFEHAVAGGHPDDGVMAMVNLAMALLEVFFAQIFDAEWSGAPGRATDDRRCSGDCLTDEDPVDVGTLAAVDAFGGLDPVQDGGGDGGNGGELGEGGESGELYEGAAPPLATLLRHRDAMQLVMEFGRARNLGGVRIAADELYAQFIDVAGGERLCPGMGPFVKLVTSLFGGRRSKTDIVFAAPPREPPRGRRRVGG